MNTDSKKALTVLELIKQLREMNPDSIIWIEGCDCVDVATSVDEDKLDHTVTLHR